MSKWFFDIETYQNFFCVTFKEVETKEVQQFVVSVWRDDRIELAKFLPTCQELIGFNSKSYDDAILIVFQRTVRSKDLNGVLYRLSGRLIAEGNLEDQAVREVRYADHSWKSIDCLKIMAMDKNGIGLKQAAINLGWPLIQDLPIPYDAVIMPDQTDLILSYNLNDVGITEDLYWDIKGERELRYEINKLYKVDVTNASRSTLANILLEKFYCEAVNINRKELRDQRTIRSLVNLADCIPDNVQFKTETLNNLLQEFQSTIVRSDNKFKYAKDVYFEGKKYQLGVGGLHSVDDPANYEHTDLYRLVNMDVSSYYPSLVLNLKVKPEHIDNAFLDIMAMLRDQRLEAKHNGQKKNAEALKIVINSIYGKFGFDKYWLYDPLAMLKITLAGQMYLMMLVEVISHFGHEVLSANTDGLLVRVRSDKYDELMTICEEWKNHLNLELEIHDYMKYVCRDVNNYVAQPFDDEVKQTGIFGTKHDVMKMRNYPIIAHALNDYFLKDIPIEDTIKSSENILDFTMSQKSGPTFQMEYHTRKGIEKLQKTVRFYASNLGGSLWKRSKNTGELTAVLKNQNIRIANDLREPKDIIAYDVDLDYYISLAYQTVDEIEPRYQQMSFI